MKFMEYQLQLIRKSRENFISLMEGLSLEALNLLSAPFNNNLIWNFGHIIVTQQLLCYRLSGNDPHIKDELIFKYRKGTKPDTAVGRDEVEELKVLAFSLLDQFERDFEKGIFKQYQAYPTSYGVQLTNIEEALTFNALHEALHLGYGMAQKKLLL